MAAFPPRNRRDQTLIAVAVIAVLCGGAYWQLVYQPKSLDLTGQQSHIDSLVASNQRVRAELARGDVNTLREQALRYQQNLQLMRQLVPTSNEVPALLEQVSTAARRVNLDIDGVAPQPVITGDDFDTYRYQLTVIGPYHELAEFLTNVGSLTRIVAPVDLHLAPATSDQRKDHQARPNEQLLTSKFEIQTYVAKSDRAVANGHQPGAKTS
jgi:type IV pilus assembly protein PilO